MLSYIVDCLEYNFFFPVVTHKDARRKGGCQAQLPSPPSYSVATLTAPSEIWDVRFDVAVQLPENTPALLKILNRYRDTAALKGEPLRLT